MLTPQLIRSAIEIMGKARVTGAESRHCAETIDAFERIYVAVTTPNPSEENPTEEKPKDETKE